jgi:hypothetical protein
MTTAYTSVLKLALPVTGELDGTWGDVVNNNITSMIEQAIVGLATVNTWSTASHTLTTADGTTSESRCAILDCSGSPGAAATVICPTATKIYILKNGVSGGYAVTLKTSAGTGISVPNGKVMWLYCDGTNVVDATTHLSSLTLASALPVASGGTGTTTSTGSGSVVLATAPTISSLTLGSPLPVASGGSGTTTSTGSGSVVLATAPTISSLTLGSPLPVASGGTATTTSTGSGSVVLATSPTVTTATLTNPTVTNYVETLYSATGSTTVDLSNGTVQKITTNGNITVTLPSSVSGKSFVLIIAYTGAHTVTWAGGSTLKWPSGTAPVQTKINGKFDIFSFIQDGTNTYGTTYGANF